tara:strand:+ start:25352 stop:26338 length:987 start_codon:yes stop_codon:yes gene_type:complete
MKKLFFLFIILTIASSSIAQGPFSPAADSLGSTAIHMDSTAIVGWVNNVSITRGPQDISKVSGPLANVGDANSVYGKADGNVLSLGDGGSVIITLSHPFSNKPSFDFAVFENGFYDQGNGGYFLELAFVEVSSDGVNFYRFPNRSLTNTDVQTSTFGTTDPTNIDGFAGKYAMTYGTPFDLLELDSVNGLDINRITHLKIIDVVGSINSSYATYDSKNNIINDPYPTNFGSSGFDLDAVALLDSSLATGIEEMGQGMVTVYPNPATQSIHVSGTFTGAELSILDMNGNQVIIREWSSGLIDVSFLPKGVYLIVIKSNTKIIKSKFLKI